jgi:uncharacterized membrane protein YidH (DUF202 family)
MPDFKLKIIHSQSQNVFPKIVFYILILLLVIMLIQAVMKAKKENRPLFNLKDKKFFVENPDKVKLFGTLILLIVYVVSMKLIGFIPSSILSLTLFNLLYAAKRDKKEIRNSIGISIVETMLIWVVFGYMFNITLP